MLGQKGNAHTALLDAARLPSMTTGPAIYEAMGYLLSHILANWTWGILFSFCQASMWEMVFLVVICISFICEVFICLRDVCTTTCSCPWLFLRVPYILENISALSVLSCQYFLQICFSFDFDYGFSPCKLFLFFIFM